MEKERASFYEPDIIVKQVAGKVQKIESQGESIDYLTFVPDGEPHWTSILEKKLRC